MVYQKLNAAVFGSGGYWRSVGWAVGVALLVAPIEPIRFFSVAVSAVGGGVGLGAVTGIALVWLLRQPAKEAQKGRQPPPTLRLPPGSCL